MSVTLFSDDDEAIHNWVHTQPDFVVTDMLYDFIENPLANIVVANTLDAQKRQILIELLKAKRNRRV